MPKRMLKQFRHITVAIFVAALAVFIAMPAANAYAKSSEELFAEADAVMDEIDALQTKINKEKEAYDAALADHKAASAAAAAAEKQIAIEQERMNFYQEQLSLLMTSMYKMGDSSLMDVILGSTSFEEFLTNWDSYSAVSEQGADLVRDAKAAKAAQEEAKKEYNKQSKLAESKMKEAETARKEMEAHQSELREEAEKLTAEAERVRALEELEKEAARQAAAAAEAADKARKEAEKEGKGITGSSVVSGSGLLNHPLPSAGVSSPFGWRSYGGGTFHLGIDFGAATGTPYYAAANGTVIFTSNDNSYNGGAGNWIVIAHGYGLVTKYMHSSEVYVSVGDVVERGQKIGAVGSTGESTGPHLHFQVEYNGVAVDPANLL